MTEAKAGDHCVRCNAMVREEISSSARGEAMPRLVCDCFEGPVVADESG